MPNVLYTIAVVTNVTVMNIIMSIRLRTTSIELSYIIIAVSLNVRKWEFLRDVSKIRVGNKILSTPLRKDLF